MILSHYIRRQFNKNVSTCKVPRKMLERKVFQTYTTKMKCNIVSFLAEFF